MQVLPPPPAVRAPRGRARATALLDKGKGRAEGEPSRDYDDADLGGGTPITGGTRGRGGRVTAAQTMFSRGGSTR